MENTEIINECSICKRDIGSMSDYCMACRETNVFCDSCYSLLKRGEEALITDFHKFCNIWCFRHFKKVFKIKSLKGEMGIVE